MKELLVFYIVMSMATVMTHAVRNFVFIKYIRVSLATAIPVNK